MHVEIKGMSPLLSVFDMPTSLAFYRDVLGFKVIHDSGKGDNSGWGNAPRRRCDIYAKYGLRR